MTDAQTAPEVEEILLKKFDVVYDHHNPDEGPVTATIQVLAATADEAVQVVHAALEANDLLNIQSITEVPA